MSTKIDSKKELPWSDGSLKGKQTIKFSINGVLPASFTYPWSVA